MKLLQEFYLREGNMQLWMSKQQQQTNNKMHKQTNKQTKQKQQQQQKQTNKHMNLYTFNILKMLDHADPKNHPPLSC